MLCACLRSNKPALHRTRGRGIQNWRAWGVHNILVVPSRPQARLCLAITGHRASHPQVANNHDRISAILASIFDLIANRVDAVRQLDSTDSVAPARLHTLLADGIDQIAAQMAVARGWDLASPLPFGRRLNTAINALPVTLEDADALLAGGEARDAEVDRRARAIEALADRASLFELAEQDAAIAAQFRASFEGAGDDAAAQHFAADKSRRVALSGRILIEQSDIVIGVWDGVTTAHPGGTGHTIATALALGAPVVWIDPRVPEAWRVLRAPEALAAPPAAGEQADRERAVSAFVGDVLAPADNLPVGNDPNDRGLGTLEAERWRPRSNPLGHAYRRTEALFGLTGGDRFRSISRTYQHPDAIADGTAAGLLASARALPGADPVFLARIEDDVLRRFAYADGISAHLSDSYRGGMIVNFLLSFFAIIGGIAYLPLVPAEQKWGFALFELVLLSAILVITYRGRKLRWHGRWFETRRVAEYLRNGSLLLILGVTRAPGRWAHGTETSWPEWYARQALRAVGLPRVALTVAYLRDAMTGPLDAHVVAQRDYHFAKAKRLNRVHHNLDRLSGFLFQLAVISVTIYLALKAGAALGWVDPEGVAHASKSFTVLGVFFPTLGSTIAGIRFFGDFERFAAISEVTAEKLEAIHGRILLLATAPDRALDYGGVAELAHAVDDVVVAEIENWQAVFGGKHITVPV